MAKNIRNAQQIATLIHKGATQAENGKDARQTAKELAAELRKAGGMDALADVLDPRRR
jgi:uncharacterized membrane protein YcaP (DUF421 family)